jgi:hypothetical protein
MEPSGRNRLQAVANATAPETAQIGENRCRGLRLVAAASNGKERVDGSSPSEDSQRRPVLWPDELTRDASGRASGMRPSRAPRGNEDPASVTSYGVYSSALATGSLPQPLGLQFASLPPPTLRT